MGGFEASSIGHLSIVLLEFGIDIHLQHESGWLEILPTIRGFETLRLAHLHLHCGFSSNRRDCASILNHRCDASQTVILEIYSSHQASLVFWRACMNRDSTNLQFRILNADIPFSQNAIPCEKSRERR
jgi:hypothetical protein